MPIEITLDTTGESGDSFVNEAVEWMNELDESDHESDEIELEGDEDQEVEPSEGEEEEEEEDSEFDEEDYAESDLDQGESDGEPAESEYKANPNWQPEEKELFNSLSEDGKKAFLEVDSRREKVFAQIMQERAAEREKYAALEQFGQQLEHNPAFKDHVVSFFNGSKTAQEDVEVDPLEELENNATKRAIEAMRQEETQRLFKQVAESTARDPLRQQVIQGLKNNLDYIASKESMSLTEAVTALDNDPRFHLKWYQAMRSVIDKEQGEQNVETEIAKKNTKPKAQKVKTFSKAGAQAPHGRKARIKAAKERAIGGDEFAIGDLIGAVFD